MSHSALLPPDVRIIERGWLSSNNVLMLGAERSALVDTGYVSHSAQTVALIRRALDGRPLDLLVNTHLHSDHCGGNAGLQAAYPNLKTLIPPGEADAVKAWDQARLSYQATGQECPRFTFDGTLVPGSEVTLGDCKWEIHAAPGHDPHAILLFEPQSRVLISADALWKKGFGVVFPEMWGEPSFDEVAATLDHIESLRPGYVIPGHGPAFSDVVAALDVARERLTAFVQSPDRHARHAIKVLIKFKLLDAGQMSRVEFEAWLLEAKYLGMVAKRFAPGRPLLDWARELTAELVQSGALRLEQEIIFNSN